MVKSMGFHLFYDDLLNGFVPAFATYTKVLHANYQLLLLS